MQAVAKHSGPVYGQPEHILKGQVKTVLVTEVADEVYEGLFTDHGKGEDKDVYKCFSPKLRYCHYFLSVIL